MRVNPQSSIRRCDVYVECRRIFHVLFYRALVSRPLYGGRVLLGKFPGNLYFHGNLFNPVGCFIALYDLFETDAARINLPGFAKLQDVISGAGGQGSKEEFKGSRSTAVSTVFLWLIGVHCKGIKTGIYPGAAREVNGYFHSSGLSGAGLFGFQVIFGQRPVSINASAAAGGAVRGSGAAVG